jgi:hypothetical protein
MIAGNPMARGENRNSSYKKVFIGGIKKDERWREYLTHEQIEKIKEDKSVQYMKNILVRYSL